MSVAQAVIAELRADPGALRELAEALAPYAPAPTALPEDGWIGTREAAAYLGTTPGALNNLTAARAVPFQQECPGGRCWFKRSELDAYRRGEWRP